MSSRKETTQIPFFFAECILTDVGLGKTKTINCRKISVSPMIQAGKTEKMKPKKQPPVDNVKPNLKIGSLVVNTKRPH